MGVRYFNADTNSNLTRPTGFVFPVGLNSNDGLSVDYLVIGGGAGAGGTAVSSPNAGGSGAGGAGGFLTGSGHSVAISTPYAITVGGGGLVEDLELKEVMVLHLYSRLLLQPAAVVVAVV